MTTQTVAHLQPSHKARMSEIAEHFHCLRGAPGVRPFDPHLLAHWSKKASHGEGCAARFILGVWSGNGKFPGVKAFDFYEAIGVWDDGNRVAFMDWVAHPYWP